MKTNNESVKDYHAKLTSIKVRFPSPDDELGIPDYAALMRERAKNLGFVNVKGKDKGQGSINAYILNLIENDLQIEMIKGLSDIKED